MLSVNGLVVIPEEMNMRRNDVKDGSYLSFVVVSQDYKKQQHRYQASIFIREKEVDEWEKKIQPGNVFNIEHGYWEMKEYEGGKYPIPQIRLNSYNFKKLKTAFWLDQEEME